VPFGRRVDLVAAHDEKAAAGKLLPTRRDGFLGEPVGDRVGGVEAVPEVRDVIDPERALLRDDAGDAGPLHQLVGTYGVERRHKEAAVRVLAEQAGDDDLEEELGQEHRIEPVRHAGIFLELVYRVTGHRIFLRGRIRDAPESLKASQSKSFRSPERRQTFLRLSESSCSGAA